MNYADAIIEESTALLESFEISCASGEYERERQNKAKKSAFGCPRARTLECPHQKTSKPSNADLKSEGLA